MIHLIWWDILLQLPFCYYVMTKQLKKKKENLPETIYFLMFWFLWSFIFATQKVEDETKALWKISLT